MKIECTPDFSAQEQGGGGGSTTPQYDPALASLCIRDALERCNQSGDVDELAVGNPVGADDETISLACAACEHVWSLRFNREKDRIEPVSISSCGKVNAQISAGLQAIDQSLEAMQGRRRSRKQRSMGAAALDLTSRKVEL